ncbi:MAG: 50S ribosomal protein L31e [Candidatus Micrarchaeota archaeon]|nr:50S ribosomal protein L31e [Candidatus Micrarchaeota archaeon]
MANLERIYTIPLGDIYDVVRQKRGKRAVKFVREFAVHHMKAAEGKISAGVNDLIFRDGIQKPPRRIKVRIVKGDDQVAKVWLIGEEEKLKQAVDAKKKVEEQKKKDAEKKADDAKKAAEAKKAVAASAAKPAATAATPAAKPAAPAPAKPAAFSAPAPSIAKK